MRRAFDFPDRRQAILSRFSHDRQGEPVVHPNGFIQVKIRGGGRLHFWHPDLPRQEVRTPVHDHVFDMHSDVLLGAVTHVEVRPLISGNGDYVVHYALPEPGHERQTTLVSSGQRVNLEERPALAVSADQSYDFPAFRFHRSDDRAGAAVSCITKTGEHVGSPRVLVPHWAEPDNGFKRDDLKLEFCRAWVERIVEEAALPGDYP